MDFNPNLLSYSATFLLSQLISKLDDSLDAIKDPDSLRPRDV